MNDELEEEIQISDIKNIKNEVSISNTLETCVEFIKKRIREDKDLVIAITGDEGIGKSTLAIWLGMSIDEEFTLEKNELFSPSVEEMESKVRGLPKYSVIVADEAIKILYKLYWMTKGQRYLNRLFSIVRDENKVIILCIPRFIDLNEWWRHHRVKIWVHVMERGVAIVDMKDWSKWIRDPWHMDENQRNLDKSRGRRRLASFSTEDKVFLFTKGINFLAFFRFTKLPDNVDERYKELKRANKYIGEEQDDEKYMRTKQSLSLVNSIGIDCNINNMSISELCDKYKLKESTIHKYLRNFKADSETLLAVEINSIKND